MTNVSPQQIGTWLGMLLLAGGTAGCVQTRLTEPKETAVEQLLISTAADRAIDQAYLDPLKGKKVYLDTTYFDSYRKEYVIGTLRDALSSHGALLMTSAQDADIIVEARNAALSIDSADSLVGIPQMPVPVPFAGTFQFPEVPFFKSSDQNSIAKIALLAYSRKTRKHIYSNKPLLGTAYNHYYVLLGYIKFHFTDLPEKKEFKNH